VVPETELPQEIRKPGHRLVEANSRPFIQCILENIQHAADDAITQAMTVLITNPGAAAKDALYVKAGSERVVLRWPRTENSDTFRPTPLKSCAV
jgi:hypothetical protein